MDTQKFQKLFLHIFRFKAFCTFFSLTKKNFFGCGQGVPPQDQSATYSFFTPSLKGTQLGKGKATMNPYYLRTCLQSKPLTNYVNNNFNNKNSFSGQFKKNQLFSVHAIMHIRMV